MLENACLTTLALLAPLLPRVSARFDVDALTEQLQQRRSSPHESQTSSQLLASSTHADASTDMAASQAPSSASDSKVLVDPTASMQSNKSEDVESSTSRDVRSKADIWSDIKLLSFAKSLTSLYVATLVACLTHLQLAILGKDKTSSLGLPMIRLTARVNSKASVHRVAAASVTRSSQGVQR